MRHWQSVYGRAAAGLAAVALLAAAGCASSRPPKPDFPVDVDPCAAYCLVWVPPVYRDVPVVVPKKCACIAHEKVAVQKTCFEEVCVPGRYEQRCKPDECRRYEFVQVTPARDEWRKVNCPCEPECCWKRERVPPQYKVCEKTETEKGFEYCAYTPPQYDIVAKTKTVCEDRTRYVPPEYGVCYRKELYTPGHWEWKAKYGCEERCKKPCPQKPNCLPGPGGPGCGCDCRGIPAAD